MGAVLSYISIAINIIASLLYTPWMIAQVGQGDYGLYTLANSLITLFLVDFGLSVATSRYISKYRAEGRQDKIDNFLAAVYRLYLLIDSILFVVLLVIYFFIERIYVSLTPDELEKFKVVYIIAASFAVINFPFVTFNGILNSYEKFIPLKLADVIYRILLVAMTVVALLFGMGLYALVAVHAIVGLLVVIFKFIVIKKSVPISVNWRYKGSLVYKEILGFSIWATVSSLAQRLVFNITPSILGIVANSAAIAIFGIVSIVEGYAFTITTAINGMFMPKISRIYENENWKKDIMKLMLGVGRFQYAINGLIIAGFAVVGKSFLDLWLGESGNDLYWGIMLVLIPGLFFNSLQIANTAMIVDNKVKLQAIVNVIMGVTNVVLSVICSYYIGVLGACLSIFAAYMLRVIVLIIIYHRIMGFDMIKFLNQCYVKMSIPIIATILIGLALSSVIPSNTFGGFILMVGLITLIYVISVFLIGLGKEEKLKVLRFRISR
jgi:O-antigen/teichoic acid export membrane protein